jgi:hypothetical protein
MADVISSLLPLPLAPFPPLLTRQDDDRRTCAATDATSDAGWHDLEGFENEIEHAGSEENEYDYDRMRGMGGRSTQV